MPSVIKTMKNLPTKKLQHPRNTSETFFSKFVYDA